MSEKRFTFDREVEFEIYDNVTKKSYDGTIGCQEKICQLLNELNEENERLRSLYIDIIETIVKEPFYQEIFKEFLFENPDVLIKGE